MKALNGIDILKFLMAILIVGEHSCIYALLGDTYVESVMKNIPGICVPVFFIVSSFFFFSKFRKAETDKERVAQVWKFEKRIISLYVFWSIVNIPYAVYLQHQRGCDAGMVQNLLRDFFFGNAFTGSWFLGAMMVGVPLIALVTGGGNKRYSKVGEVLLGISVTLLYIYVFEPAVYPALDAWYRAHFVSPILSFPRGLLWLMTGYVLSSPDTLEKVKSVSIYLMALLLIVALLVSPCYPSEYSGIPTAILMFVCTCRLRLKDSPVYKRLRIYSIVIYCSHGTVIPVVSRAFHLFFQPNGIVQLVVTVLVCCCMAEILLRLSRTARFSFLRSVY